MNRLFTSLIIFCAIINFQSVWSFEFPIHRDFCNPQSEPLLTGVSLDNLGASELLPAPPIFNSFPTADATLLLDFDGHTEDHPFWGGVMDAPVANYTESQMTKVSQVVAEFFRPWKINVTTDSIKYNSTAANRRIRVVFTSGNVVASTGQAQAWSFADPDGASAVVEISGKNVNAVAATAAHEAGHAFGLKHDGDAGNGTSFAYYQTVDWAPIMGGTSDNIDYQWNRGDYQDANNPEDDMSILTEAPNNLDYRDDEQGGDVQSAEAINFTGENIISTEGVIEYHTDVDAWKFKSDGGNANIQVSSYGIYEVLEPGALLINTDNGSEYPLIGNRNQVSFNGNITAGNYILRVYSGIYYSSVLEGPTNYGSVGTYTISGSVSNNKPSDALSLSPVIDFVKPISNTINLTTEGAFDYEFQFNVFGLTDYEAYVFINGQAVPVADQGNNLWSFIHRLRMSETILLEVAIEYSGQWMSSKREIQVIRQNIGIISPNNISVNDFSSEFPDNPRFNISPGLAINSIDGNRLTVWSGGPDSINVVMAPNGTDTLFADIYSFKEYPHWIELAFDAKYDLAGFRIQGTENIVDGVPDSMDVHILKNGNLTKIHSHRFERSTDLVTLFEDPSNGINIDQVRLTFYRSFSGREVMGVGEIIPLYYVEDSTTLLEAVNLPINQIQHVQYHLGQRIELQSHFKSPRHRVRVVSIQGATQQELFSDSQINIGIPGKYFVVNEFNGQLELVIDLLP